MSKTSDKILIAREARANKIALFLNQGYIVLTFHANIPGTDKNINHAYMLVKYFSKHFLPSQEHTMFFKSADGPYVIKLFKEIDPHALKLEAIKLEDTHPLGRLIDIDVHTVDGQIERSEKRTCLICGRLAAECIRLKRHSVSECLEMINRMSTDFLAETIEIMVDKAMLSELDLEPKFGLVSKSDSGSHNDMDYELMKRAKTALLPFFRAIFLSGYQAKNLIGLFDRIRAIGLEAEHEMFHATDKVNAYKGLIFSLGITLAASGYSLARGTDFRRIFAYAKQMSSGITKELASGNETYGKSAYLNYGFKGARGEAEAGFPSVRRSLRFKNNSDGHLLHRQLISLIINSEDTVFLKRSGSLERYEKHRSKFQELKSFDNEALKRLTEFCKQQNLSFGGSADLLVTTVFLSRFRETFYG
ncbi:MAG: triphosphoribosyl-dephospho-CoA synthase [Bacilli bacterium]|nr:triphosphoribosyl-dephospho-CoA synthase [Bacilli bacterium]